MRRKGLPAAAVLIVVVGLAIAGATARPAPSADLSAAVPTALSPALQKLITTGVLPTNVTAEPGVWNYTGANCPGPGWNCVPLLGVFEITQAGTVSVVECVAATCPPITQTADVNVAKCEQKVQTTAASFSQRCIVTQTGKDNQATVVQLIEQNGSASQGALQEAFVRQTATASKNQLQVDQEIKQFTDVGTTQDQDAYQVVTGRPTSQERPPARQTAAGAGDNQAQIDQTQVQRAKGGTTQTQNDGEYAATVTLTEPPDCDPLGLPEDPHACANLEQTSSIGDNQSQLSQKIDEEATTSGVAFQQQGVEPVEVEADPPEIPFAFTIFPGGLDGRVHQETAAPGSSQKESNQDKTQKLSPVGPLALGAVQLQFDPNGCCGFGSQIGPGTEELNKKSLQEASEEAEQLLMLFSTSNSPMGSCEFNHDAQNNADQTSDSGSPESCVLFSATTVCESGPGIEEPSPSGDCETVRSDGFRGETLPTRI